MGIIFNQAIAATKTATMTNSNSIWQLAVMAIAIIALLYFTVLRPQNQRVKQQRNLMSSIKVGDEVSTLGGIIGKVVKIKENFILLAITDNVEIVIQKPAVSTILPKGSLQNIKEYTNRN